MKHIFPTLRAAVATLQAGLPGQIVAYNAEAANTQDLAAPDPARYFFGGNDNLVAGSFPAVELYIGHGSLGPFSVHRDKADLDDRVTVVVWLEGEKGEIPELYEQAAGYGRVFLEVLLRDSAFGTDVEISDEQDAVTYDYAIVPSDPQRRDFEKWRTAVVLQFRLEDVTDVP